MKKQPPQSKASGISPINRFHEIYKEHPAVQEAADALSAAYDAVGPKASPAQSYRPKTGTGSEEHMRYLNRKLSASGLSFVSIFGDAPAISKPVASKPRDFTEAAAAQTKLREALVATGLPDKDAGKMVAALCTFINDNKAFGR